MSTPTYEELQVRIRELTRQAEEIRQSERGEAIAQIRAIMQDKGITVEDLAGSSSQRRGSAAVAAKYRDPASGQTWSGRGRTPAWLVAAESSGAPRDQFLI